jgi:ABC-type cobalamin/Fe3+-siderophores transport systems, ATPase components
MLRLENVSAGYGKVPVIREINAEFEKGRITTIVGPNGSGKSTLLKAAVHLCEVQEGTVYLKGKKREEIGSREFAQQVSYLPQSHTAGAITVGRMVLHGRFPYLSYPRHYGKEDYEFCRKAMEKIGILPLRDKKVDELSGGQRQKVYLAMALSGETDVFLFDEPTTYLDIRYQLELLQLMEQLKEQGKAVVTVLHDLDIAMRVSDSMIVMQDGKIVQTGSPEEIQSSGMIERVFQITAQSFVDQEGKKHFYFEQQERQREK